MKPIIGFDVFAKQFALHAGSMIKLECKLNTNAAAAVFVQVHDNEGTPAEGAIPLKSWPAAGDAELYKEFKRGEIHFTKGLYVCVSTTEATKTLGTGSNKFSMVAAELVDDDYPLNTLFAGDLVTQVASLEVWTDANGPKKLIALEIDATGHAGNVYAMVFAHDTPVDGDVPVLELKVSTAAANTGTNGFRFGIDGRDVLEDDGGTIHDGCTVVMSSTPKVLTTAAADIYIYAEYK